MRERKTITVRESTIPQQVARLREVAAHCEAISAEIDRKRAERQAFRAGYEAGRRSRSPLRWFFG